MKQPNNDLHEFDRQLVWLGFTKLAPISLFVTIFGAAFGLAATQAGLNETVIVAMSTLVFAGAAQFAALELWGRDVSLAAIAITVFAINARHLLMGATLYPWLQHLTKTKRYGIMLVVSDANWALSMQAFGNRQPGMGLLLGGGLVLWLSWVIGTWIGVLSGGAIHDPKALGLDRVMACFLLAMVVGGDKSLRLLIIWIVAACASLLAYRYLPENSNVIVGAVAGGIAGTIRTENKHER